MREQCLQLVKTRLSEAGCMDSKIAVAKKGRSDNQCASPLSIGAVLGEREVLGFDNPKNQLTNQECMKPRV